jgi:hypothetical protein
LYHSKYWRDYGTFSILPLHGTYFSDIVFDNIRVEYTQAKLFCFRFGTNLYGGGIPGDHSFPGGISNVTIRNVSVDRQAGGIRSEFSGYAADKRIEDVTIENLRYGGRCVADKASMGLACNAHVSGVRFVVPPGVERLERARAKPDPAKGPLWLVFSAGMRDDAKGTDGVVLKIHAAKAGQDETARELLSEHIFKRSWRDCVVNLSAYRGKRIVLQASVDQGGHTKFDWFCWGAPRIVRVTKAGQEKVLDLVAAFDKARRGLVAAADKPLAPLEAGAQATRHAGENSGLLSGGVRKPGVFFHPPWKEGRRAPVAVRWSVDLPAD